MGDLNNKSLDPVQLLSVVHWPRVVRADRFKFALRVFGTIK